MLRYTTILAMLLIAATSFAINPVKNKTAKKSNSEILSEGSDRIDSELENLLLLESAVAENEMDYAEAAAAYPGLVDNANVTTSINEGLLDGSPDVPLGVPGFWWGFCLGWVGMLIVYLTMDDGSERKEQVKNALYGCIISTAVSIVFWLLVIAGSS